MNASAICTYVTPDRRERQVRLSVTLDPAIERARVNIQPTGGVVPDVAPAPTCIVIEAEGGVLKPWQLSRLDDALAAYQHAWAYYPREQAVETVDRERLASYARLQRVARVLWPVASVAALGRRRRSPMMMHAAGVQREQSGVARLSTGDAYKDAAQDQWDFNPAGSHYAAAAPSHTLDWFEAIERHRYHEYAPWMPEVMEFDRHRGRAVLEIGGGLGTDLCQFARYGARVTDVDLSSGHLRLARENFALRGLAGRFIHHDAERLPFDDASFDVVYSNGVLHHTTDTPRLVAEIHRVLRPGGRVIAMVYAESSFHFWYRQVWIHGLVEGRLRESSIGEVLSRTAEVSDNDASPLVKVYSRARLDRLLAAFAERVITQHQLTAGELPLPLRPFRSMLEPHAGWNLVVKAVRA
jgi:ubiquinone/menaquinone biosynthesis C-methylase UbiE